MTINVLDLPELDCPRGGKHSWRLNGGNPMCRKCGQFLNPTEDEGPICPRCEQPGPASTWGKYRGIYCDPCAGAMALERLRQ